MTRKIEQTVELVAEDNTGLSDDKPLVTQEQYEINAEFLLVYRPAPERFTERKDLGLVGDDIVYLGKQSSQVKKVPVSVTGVAVGDVIAPFKGKKRNTFNVFFGRKRSSLARFGTDAEVLPAVATAASEKTDGDGDRD